MSAPTLVQAIKNEQEHRPGNTLSRTDARVVELFQHEVGHREQRVGVENDPCWLVNVGNEVVERRPIPVECIEHDRGLHPLRSPTATQIRAVTRPTVLPGGEHPSMSSGLRWM